MRIAFYCPMKSPTHPVPSGDRQIARLIMQTVQKDGHEIELVSSLRSWVKDPKEHQLLKQEAIKEAEVIFEKLKSSPPDLWLTYHLYHKAPDWIGEFVSQKLDIPYHIIEASYAAKREDTEWDFGLQESKRQICLADKLYAFHEKDKLGLQELPLKNEDIQLIAPFVDREIFQLTENDKKSIRQTFIEEHNISSEKKLICTAAMMRTGDKYRSYEILAKAIHQLDPEKFCLLVAGDGEERENIEKLFPAETIFLGELNQQAVAELYAACDFFIWPAINEAICLAILEAQVSGLPVICGETSVLRDIIQHQKTGYLIQHGTDNSFVIQIVNYVNGLFDQGESIKEMSRRSSEIASINCGLAAFTLPEKLNKKS